MRVIEVIPIVKGITKATLSYFSKDKLPLGSFVRIPVRSGYSQGLVVGSKDARSAKSSIKRADFSLKKISLSSGPNGIPPSLLKAIEQTAMYYTTTIGNILSSVLAKTFLENPNLIGKSIRAKQTGVREVKVIQLGGDERFREYRSVIRESFAKGSSVLFVVPNNDDALMAKEELSMGIEDFVYAPTLAKPKVLESLLIKARDEKHPILFITTPLFIAFSRGDLRTFILERESSRAYRTLSRPYINFKTFLEYYSKSSGANLILGDAVLSIETLWHEREGRYTELTPLSWRQKIDSHVEIVDMREKKDFHILSEKLSNSIKEALLNGKNIFLFGVRRGVAPTTICGDCASLLLCRNCSAPLVLHKDTYLCHHCGAKRSTETRCDTCQSWKLNPLGIGIDRIVEECQSYFPDTNIFVIDKDTTNTKSKVRETLKNFESTRGAILIGTELALSNMKKASLVGVVSLDTLFSIPDFLINEKIFHLITRLREVSKDNFLIQTRNAGAEILKHAATGNVLDFYRVEIKDREELSYPPFSIFIKVSIEGKRSRLETASVELKSNFLEYDPHFILGKKSGKDTETLSMILRLKKEVWPNQDLVEKLLLLTPEFLIKVDPESIL